MRAMVLLCRARLLIGWVPLECWRRSIGPGKSVQTGASSDEARRLAAHVHRAGQLLPFHSTCLSQAMALSWMLRGRAIRHSLVIAVRPAEVGSTPDRLHAWLEVNGATIIGDLPGPWVEMLRLGP